MDAERRRELEEDGYVVGEENPIEELAAECVECGQTSRGKATVWLTKDEEGNTVVRDDVSYLCRDCGEVTDRDIRVTKRGDEPWVWKDQ